MKLDNNLSVHLCKGRIGDASLSAPWHKILRGNVDLALRDLTAVMELRLPSELNDSSNGYGNSNKMVGFIVPSNDFLLVFFMGPLLIIKARVAMEELRRLVEGDRRDNFISGLVKKITSTMLNRLVSRFSTTIERYLFLSNTIKLLTRSN
ncbi:hypothetical protein EON65_44425 [archaeon]|nr:MAG: hypothetical protein EON65_44425 [archaeon]